MNQIDKSCTVLLPDSTHLLKRWIRYSKRFIFWKCTANHSLRNNLFNKIILNKPYFIEEIPLNKIKCLLNENSELLVEVGDFIKQSTELQNEVLVGQRYDMWKI